MALTPFFENDHEEEVFWEEEELTNQDIAFNNLYDAHFRLDNLIKFHNTPEGHEGKEIIDHIISKPQESLSIDEQELLNDFKEQVIRVRKIYLTFWFSYSLLLLDQNLTPEDQIDLKRHSPHSLKLEGGLKFFPCPPPAPIVTPGALNRLVSNVLETVSSAPRNSCN